MFERYTPRALTAIFSAHHNAIGRGSPEIEPEHLILGLLYECTLRPCLPLRVSACRALLVRHKEWLREQIYAHASNSDDITPLNELRWSSAIMPVLQYAVEEADRLSDKWVGIEHLLLGLLREQNCFAATLLNKKGILLETARTAIASEQRDQEEQRRNPTPSPPSI